MYFFRRELYFIDRPQIIHCTFLLTFVKHEAGKQIIHLQVKISGITKDAFPFLRRVGILKPSSLQHYIQTHLTNAERTRVQPVVFMFHAHECSQQRGEKTSTIATGLFSTTRFLV